MDGVLRFNSALYAVAPEIRRVLEFLPEGIKRQTEEIRLRAGLPVCITVRGENLFVTKGGQTADYISGDLLIATKDQLQKSFMLLCRNSVFAHCAELRSGYISMPSGHRAGVCGTLNEQGNIRDVTSINIRIAREVFGCADEIVKNYDNGGILIAGPPGSGKTTVLRDLIRQLSYGFSGRYYRIAVIDSRGELSGNSSGETVNDLGPNTDVLMISNKALGMEMAVRTMFPDIVAFDEIGTAGELSSVSESFNAGVSVITTAHAGSIKELGVRSVTSELISSGAINKVVFLSAGRQAKMKIFAAEEFEKYVCD